MAGNTSSSNSVLQEGQPTVFRRKVKKPLAKLVIGMFAGLCAAFFPRLVLLINAIGQDIQLLDIFDPQYLICAFLFSVIVGVVVMLFEWHVVNEPGKTFMMALSVPALIAGGLNTNTALNLYESDTEINTRLSTVFEDSTPVKTLPVPEEITEVQPEFQKESSLLLHLGGRSAHAGGNSLKPTQFLALRVKKELFMVMLDKANSREGAFNKANEIRKKCRLKDIEVVKFGQNKFGVVCRGAKFTRPEALLVIHALRKVCRGLHPSLLPIPD
ncbi:MAG: hypothetical protein JRD68_14030 [Deltaproteobacteria bacterium]|nr:hypothetical protein [Deltaproteobacteria bacterium]